MNNRKITQENLWLILPGKISRVAAMYASDFGVSVIDAIKKIYASETYKQLEQESTKLWHYGPVALYQELLERN